MSCKSVKERGDLEGGARAGETFYAFMYFYGHTFIILCFIYFSIKHLRKMTVIFKLAFRRF